MSGVRQTKLNLLVAGVGNEVKNHRRAVEKVESQPHQEDLQQLGHHARTRHVCQYLQNTHTRSQPHAIRQSYTGAVTHILRAVHFLRYYLAARDYTPTINGAK